MSSLGYYNQAPMQYGNPVMLHPMQQQAPQVYYEQGISLQYPIQDAYQVHGGNQRGWGNGGRNYRRRRQEYFQNAPPDYACTILPVEDQGNAEFESVRSGVAAVMAIWVSASEGIRNSRIAAFFHQIETPMIPRPQLSIKDSPRHHIEPISRVQVAKITSAQLIKLQASVRIESTTGSCFSEVAQKLQSVCLNIADREVLAQLADSLVSFAVENKGMSCVVAELIALLTDSTEVIETASSDEENDSQGSQYGDELILLGTSKRFLTLQSLVNEYCIQYLDACDDVTDVASFVAKLCALQLSELELVKSCVSKVITGFINMDDYIDQDAELDASPEHYRRCSKIIRQAFPEIAHSPYYDSAITYAAHIREYYLDDDEDDNIIIQSFRAKSTPLPVIKIGA